jgi:hypothetical protein
MICATQPHPWAIRDASTQYVDAAEALICEYIVDKDCVQAVLR